VRSKFPFRFVLVAWLLMSGILTNSYKGLIISYLSVPFAPKQDYSYFEQLTGFQLYSPVTAHEDAHYWLYCNGSKNLLARNTTCNKALSDHALFGKYAQGIMKLEFSDRQSLVDINIPQEIEAFPRKESKEVFSHFVMNGREVAIVGLHSEIEEMLLKLNTDFKGTRFFKGKENLWSHKKVWLFPTLSYDQEHHDLTRMVIGGIYQVWKYWLRDRKFLEFKVKDEDLASPEPLSLHSNVAFMFVILILGLSTSAIYFLSENLYHAFKRCGFRLILDRLFYRLKIRCCELYISLKKLSRSCKCTISKQILNQRVCRTAILMKSKTIRNLKQRFRALTFGFIAKCRFTANHKARTCVKVKPIA
jgi:hypothetical protein